MWNPFTPIVRFLLGRNGALNEARKVRNEATGELKSALQSYITNVQQLNKTAITLNNLSRLMNTPKNNQTLAYNKRIGAAVAKMVNASKNAIFASKNANNARRAKEEAARAAKEAKEVEKSTSSYNKARAAANKLAVANAKKSIKNKEAANAAAAAEVAKFATASNKARAAANKLAVANAAEKLRWRQAKISVQNLNKIMKGVIILDPMDRRTRWMKGRGVSNYRSTNAKAKAEANKELNNKRIFGKSKYKLLWENIIPLPLSPPPTPAPPPKPAPAPAPAPPPVPPPAPAQPQIENKSVAIQNTKGQNTQNRINLTRTKNASGGYSNWTFKNSQVNKANYDILNPKANTPEVRITSKGHLVKLLKNSNNAKVKQMSQPTLSSRISQIRDEASKAGINIKKNASVAEALKRLAERQEAIRRQHLWIPYTRKNGKMSGERVHLSRKTPTERWYIRDQSISYRFKLTGNNTNYPTLEEKP